jgi:tRNA threonylcarbamoyl adenosine modification protein YjeE
VRLSLPDADATHALGLQLGSLLFPGAFVALRGDLGAGKSSLARGIARGLGIDGAVPSPTYVIVNSYEGRLTLHHADWYRLADDEELEQIGWYELAVEPAAAVVEWPERVEDALPADRLEIELRHDGDGRVAVLHATGPRHRPLELVGG